MPYSSGMSSPQPIVFDPALASVLSVPGELPYAPSGIVSRTLLATANLRVVLFSIAPGQELTEHTSSRRALVHILSGSCDFKFNGAWRTLAPGEVLHMPPGHPHAVRVATAPCSFLLVLGTDAAEVAAATTDAASEANA